MKVFKRVYVLVLVAFFLGGGVFLLLKDQADYSKNENRYLEKMPSFSFESYFDGEFQSKMDKAVTDQFPMRDVFTGLSTGMRKLAGLHDVGDVYLGKDGYYLDKKLEKDISYDQYKKNLASIKLFADRFTANTGNPSLKVMLVPSPASIVSDKLPSLAKIYDDKPYFSAAKAVLGKDRIIDVRARFDIVNEMEGLLTPGESDTSAAAGSDGGSDSDADGGSDGGAGGSDSDADGGSDGSTGGSDSDTGTADSASDGSDNSGNQLYFKTDHHWTHLGAYEGYAAYADAVGLPQRTYSDFKFKKVSDDFYGTMFSRALDSGAEPDTIMIPEVPEAVLVSNDKGEIPLYDMSKLEEKDQYAVYFGGNYPSVKIINGFKSNKRKLLIFKDSFANSMVPMLLWDYSDIEMIDLRYETRPMKVIMDEFEPDEVLVLYELSNFASTGEVARLGV